MIERVFGFPRVAGLAWFNPWISVFYSKSGFPQVFNITNLLQLTDIEQATF